MIMFSFKLSYQAPSACYVLFSRVIAIHRVRCCHVHHSSGNHHLAFSRCHSDGKRMTQLKLLQLDTTRACILSRQRNIRRAHQLFRSIRFCQSDELDRDWPTEEDFQVTETVSPGDYKCRVFGASFVASVGNTCQVESWRH